MGAIDNGFTRLAFPYSIGFLLGAVTGAFGGMLPVNRFGWPVSTAHGLLDCIVGAAVAVQAKPGPSDAVRAILFAQVGTLQLVAAFCRGSYGLIQALIKIPPLTWGV